MQQAHPVEGSVLISVHMDKLYMMYSRAFHIINLNVSKQNATEFVRAHNLRTRAQAMKQGYKNYIIHY